MIPVACQFFYSGKDDYAEKQGCPKLRGPMSLMGHAE